MPNVHDEDPSLASQASQASQAFRASVPKDNETTADLIERRDLAAMRVGDLLHAYLCALYQTHPEDAIRAMVDIVNIPDGLVELAQDLEILGESEHLASDLRPAADRLRRG